MAWKNSVPAVGPPVGPALVVRIVGRGGLRLVAANGVAVVVCLKIENGYF